MAVRSSLAAEPTENSIEAKKSCAREGFEMFHNRVGRYFLNDAPSDYGAHTCIKCGAVDALINAKGYCQSYRAMTKPRFGLDGKILPHFGAPVITRKMKEVKNEKGVKETQLIDIHPHTSMRSDNVFCFIDKTREFVACNIPPAYPTPASMTMARASPRNRLKIFQMLIEAPPEPPYLIVEFSNNLSFELVISRDANMAIYSKAPLPIAYDLKMVAAAKKALREIYTASSQTNNLDFSIRRFLTARMALVHKEPNATDKLQKILKSAPSLTPLVAQIPNVHSREFALALELVANEHQSQSLIPESETLETSHE